MNLVEALRSGKKFKRSYYSWHSRKDFGDETQQIYIKTEDLLYDDWEILICSECDWRSLIYSPSAIYACEHSMPTAEEAATCSRVISRHKIHTDPLTQIFVHPDNLKDIGLRVGSIVDGIKINSATLNEETDDCRKPCETTTPCDHCLRNGINGYSCHKCGESITTYIGDKRERSCADCVKQDAIPCPKCNTEKVKPGSGYCLTCLHKAAECSHDWKEYIGLEEKYEFCTKCDEKREVRNE